METAKERVRAALRREERTHPAFTWGFGPSEGAREVLMREFAARGLDWDVLRRETEDVAWLHPMYIGPPLGENQAQYMAIWGIETGAVDYGSGTYTDEIARSPLAGVEEPEAFDDYPWPVVGQFDYAAMQAVRQERDPEGRRAVRIQVGNPFEIYSWMTGMEEAFMNLVAEPELVEAGMAHINRFFIENLRRQVEALGPEIELAWIGDDLGAQQGPLISEKVYRSVIQPFHRELCAEIRRLLPDTVIQYHTDGSVFALVPDLLEAGVQMLEAVQVECAQMEPSALTEAYGDRLMFQGAISVQQVLPHGTPEEVHRACRELIATLGRGGGYLAAPSHAVQAGTPPENILAMLEEVLGAERYERAVEAARE